jgi:nitrate reductase delta subunit
MLTSIPFGTRAKDPAQRAAQRQALARIKEWTRAQFRLNEDTSISVAEVACALPGCPPLETVIVFWTAPDKRHHYKIFKPAQDVEASDLPPWWMRDALIVNDEFSCSCC